MLRPPIHLFEQRGEVNKVGIFGGYDEEDDNPGGNANTDAGDQGARNADEAQAKADYDEQVGSDDHERAVNESREAAGIEQDRQDED